MTTSNDSNQGPNGQKLSDNELALGKKTQRIVNLATLITIGILLVVFAYVVTMVPFTTTITYNRFSSEFRLPVFALLALPALLTFGWFRSRGPESGKMPSKERYILIIFSSAFIAFSLFAQASFALAFLEAG